MRTLQRAVRLGELEVLPFAANPVAVRIRLRATLRNAGSRDAVAQLEAEVFEIGFTGGRSSSPLAGAPPVQVGLPADGLCSVELPIQIGTPFFWVDENQHRYACVISWGADGGWRDTGEIQFGLLATGEVLVTDPFRKATVMRSTVKTDRPSLFVVGDSTAFSYGKNQLGWGDALAGCLTGRCLNVLNRARPGRSTRSFRNEGLWDRVRAEVKPGDVVLIQFGHNDADHLDAGRCRGVLPGLGEECLRVQRLDGASEVVRTYGWYLRQFIAETKAKGAIPILLSLTARNLWEKGRVKRDQSQYGLWAEQTARAAGVDFIDLTRIIADRYDRLGHAGVQPLFCSATDDVHTSPAGAEVNAECVVAELKKLLPSAI